MIRRPPRSTLSSSSAASDVYKRQVLGLKRMAAPTEIQIARDRLLELESNVDKRSDIEDAFNTLSNPRSRRSYDRSTPAQRDDLYYKGITYLTSDNFASEVLSNQSAWLVEVHAGTARPPRVSTIHNTPPNWARLMTKSAKILKGYARLGRINVDEQPGLAQQLQLAGPKGSRFKLPMIGVIHNGKVVPYKGEPRILKICDFLGDQIPSLNVDLVTYTTFNDWRTSDDRIKVLLFRKTFTRMVMVYRDAAEQFEHIMKFGEVDVRSRGAVNLWRRFNLRRLPLVAVLRDDDQQPGVLGGSFDQRMLVNFLASNRLPLFPRISSENFEETCITGGKRYCAILAADPRYITYRKINTTLEVFARAGKMFENDTAFMDQIEFAWADKVSDYLNTTEQWRSLYSVFGSEEAEHRSINFYVTDNKKHLFKDFGGNLHKVNDMEEKDQEMKDFVQEFVAGNLKATPLPSPLFQPPPPPPYTQEDVTKLFVIGVVVAVAVVALGWSYFVFQAEAAIKDEQKSKLSAHKRKKLEKKNMDGDYEIDNQG
eukprot:TRINITY_DN1822_c0_g1_i1.p1 TRINITY_DN1822_c0_g1~~TRINITY_DN1822_c0_g1_i1.p1  ORF type:complete len:540 (-),score=167.35 TRINITY_DN1822_c0_g1_i1:258-1877(-)